MVWTLFDTLCGTTSLKGVMSSSSVLNCLGQLRRRTEKTNFHTISKAGPTLVSQVERRAPNMRARKPLDSRKHTAYTCACVCGFSGDSLLVGLLGNSKTHPIDSKRKAGTQLWGAANRPHFWSHLESKSLCSGHTFGRGTHLTSGGWT